MIPHKKNYHDPNICNKDGNTVAMLLAKREIIPPK